MNPQDDPQWRLDRCGSVGGSEISDILRKGKKGAPSASRANVMARKVVERLTGVPVETFKSRAMMDGVEREPMARIAYELMYNVTVEQVGLIPHPLIKGTHASPDGLVGNLGGTEIKCPEHAAHLDTLLNEKIDSDYIKQIQWNLACSGRHWWDYVSHHPDFPPSMQLWTKRVERDASLISDMETEVKAFLKELEQKVAALQSRYGVKEAA